MNETEKTNGNTTIKDVQKETGKPQRSVEIDTFLDIEIEGTRFRIDKKAWRDKVTGEFKQPILSVTAVSPLNHRTNSRDYAPLPLTKAGFAKFMTAFVPFWEKVLVDELPERNFDVNRMDKLVG